jgi:thiol-disulfide isomerase/thioredoxin
MNMGWMGWRTVALTCSILLAGGLVAAADEVWTEDAAAATAEAKRQEKDLLLLFTGSDWCPPCQALERDVLATEAFQDHIGELFILVKFDFPQSIEQSDELVEQNRTWAERYGVESYPTILLVDSQLRPYAVTGSREGNAEEYVAHLSELAQIRQRRDARLAEAQTLEGLERARALDAALGEMDQQLAEIYYEDIVKEIVELDVDDEAGLRTKYFAEQDAETRQELMLGIALAARLQAPAEAIASIDAAIAEARLPPPLRLDALRIKLDLLRKLDQREAASALLDEMIALEGLEAEVVERLIIEKAYELFGGAREEAVAWLDDQIARRQPAPRLVVAKSELLTASGEMPAAVALLDQSLAELPDADEGRTELVAAKADTLVQMGQTDAAVTALDEAIEDSELPTRARADLALQKAMILRAAGRGRAAALAENLAIEIAATPEEKAEVQRLVDQLRRKAESAPDSSPADQ